MGGNKISKGINITIVHLISNKVQSNMLKNLLPLQGPKARKHSGQICRYCGPYSVNVFKKELQTNDFEPAHNLETGGNFMTW